MKKIYKIIIGIVLLFFVLLISLPLLFQDKMVALIKETVNNNINANLDFADADLSLLRNFPKVSLELTDVAITNFKPFEGDTLFYIKSVNLKLKLTELFKSSQGQLNINAFTIDDALINVLVDENGKANYDITKKDTEAATKTNTAAEASTFKLSLNSYAITNSTIKYTDKQGKMSLLLSDFNHSGKGDFSEQNVELDTETSTKIGFKKDKSSLINNLHLDLDAVLAMDLANNKYSFLKNEAHINQLPLIFNGFVKLNENNQEINIDFKTPSSDFKNFLALIPEEYAKNIADVKTTGNFSVTGKVNGIVSEKTIPKLDIVIASKNASFKYTDLPKSVDSININAQIKNTTGNPKNTFVSVDKLAFKIDNNQFNGKAKIENVTENPYINASLNGTIDLTDITKVYRIEMAKELSGIITANLTSSFDMNAITNNKYDRIKNNGSIAVDNFLFDGKEVANPIKINNAKVAFKTGQITLSNFDAITGGSDLKATGTITNLLGFILSDKNLQGNFNLNSNTFKVSDFMTAGTEESKTSEESTTSKTPQETLKIPAFLDCIVNATAKEVYYDNLKLKNVKGKLILKDEKATLKNVNGDMFGGSITLNGTVNTQKEKPVFDVDLGINSFDISQSFQNLEMFKMLSPVASIFKGKLNTTINLAGDLKDDFTPNLASISGKALAEILATDIDPENSKALSLLNNNLSFIDLKKIDLKNVKTNLSFDDGKVNVSPFDIKYNDIDITVAGSHSIDQNMDYKATFNVPAKYLGKEVTNLLSQLNSSDGDVTVPVTANLSGAFTSPSVKTDLSTAVSNLTSQLIQKQKNKLINNALGSSVGNLLGTNNATKTDSTTTKASVKDKAVKKVGDVLGGLFGKKKKKEY